MNTKHIPPLVLVVDDETSSALMLKHVFDREGYQVETANDGITALELAQRLKPDLILLDIQMPDMDGFEVLEKLRHNVLTSGIPTIVVSARARQPSDIAMGLNIGADDYIAKPFAPQELVARARAKMRARQLEETLQQRTKELESLLRVSEELNQHLEINELLSLVLYLTLDLIPCEMAMICQFDETGHIGSYEIQTKTTEHVDKSKLAQILLNHLRHVNHEVVWIDGFDNGYPFDNGMVMPLQHGGASLGLLVVAASEPYEQNDHMLFKGITRQAALAIHNAELYEIQANYALHLEDMVAERTKELKATQQMLFRAEKLASIGHLAASIAHEINNPLQPIRLNLEFLLEDIQSDQPIDQEVVIKTQESVERISRIVRQLLGFTKSGNEPAFKPIDLAQTLDGIIKLNRKAYEKQSIKIETEIEPVPVVEASKDQLEQVFMNMMINAMNAMPDGGTLIIRLWQNADHTANIQFKDTGVGIEEDLIHKIFDPFVSTKAEGTGLGLFVTYGIIEGHQGNIEVQSRIGQGTTFTITLPIHQGTVQPADQPNQ